MKSIRVLMMMTLLATATAVSAQTPPQPSQSNFPYPLVDVEAAQTEAQPASECPFAKALQEANVAWQRLRSMCGGAKMGCCEPGGMSNACKGAGCAAGVAKGCEAVQPPKTCCCAKACACCETCKAAKAQETVQAEQIPNPPMSCPMLPAPAGWKMQWGSGVVQIVAQPMPPALPIGVGPYGMPTLMGQAVPHGVYLPVNLGAKPAKLVTPDFEAHCDHMIQRGDTIQLVGNVLLLCKKYAQPLRVEGQRILLNLNDGSFVVEAGPALPRLPAPAIGVLRMSITDETVRPASGVVPPSSVCPLRSCDRPAELVAPAGIIEVVPVPTAPQTCPRPR